MAGRGVDIKLSDEVKELGGLAIIGTERHESRRIDNQLRGRSGRQGDPGVSQFFLSLDDNLLRIFGGEKIRNIMNRIGVKKGEFIDSKLVTRSVESAQKKVETLHYESRKHLLEYDDVANYQRKAIYEFRDQLIDKEYDIAAKIKENREEVVTFLLEDCEILDGLPSEDYDLDCFIKELAEVSGVELPKDILEGKEPAQIKSDVLEILEEIYEEKMKVFDTEQRVEVEKLIYLQTLDNMWRDHLYEMDTLKTGIGLRGYNQKDPLTEYKQESYRLFGDLIKKIKIESIKFIHRVEFNFNEEEQQQDNTELPSDAPINSTDTIEESNNNETTEPVVAAKKPKRNDPCPCGSGQKYKNCCGKSGPKKGLLA
jgi:preprotein translocase subunit SecA